MEDNRQFIIETFIPELEQGYNEFIATFNEMLGYAKTMKEEFESPDFNLDHYNRAVSAWNQLAILHNSIFNKKSLESNMAILITAQVILTDMRGEFEDGGVYENLKV